MAFPTVAIGQKIKASWGNLVAGRFNDSPIHIAFSPGANIDYTGTAQADWINLGNIIVPTWASEAIVEMSICRWQLLTALGEFGLFARIGTINAAAAGRITPTAVNDLGSVAWPSRVSGVATGTQALIVRATGTAATAVIRVGTSSRINAAVFFK